MELNIRLDTYDDLYSDFDSRHFSKRLVSEDFIHELKRSAKEMRQPVSELLLHLPANVRVPGVEAGIVQSLKKYFHNQYFAMKSEIQHLRRRGWLLTLLGFLLMIAAAYVHYINAASFLFSTIRVILEPAGWFLIWNGLETLIYELKTRKVQFIFFEKLNGCTIQFIET